MATDTTAGLFSTPEQYQQAQSQAALQNALTMGQLTPEQSSRAALMFAGNRGAAGIASALGAEDPMLKIQSIRQQVLQGLDQTNPQSMMQGAQALAQAGDNQGAAQLAQAAREAALQLAKANQENTAATKNLREATPAAVREYQVAKAEGYPGSFVDFQTQMKKAGATNVSVSTSADKSYGSELGNLVAKSDIALRDTANSAPEVLNSVQQTRALLDSGKVFTGTGANAKLNVLALGQAFGVTGATDNDVIAKTQQLQQQRSKAVLGQIKASGLGTGQGFTDKDLNFLERASAGTITLSADTIREQLKIEEKLAKASVNKWNNRVKTLPTALTSSMGLSPVELPTTPYNPSAAIPKTGNPLVDKYLVNPQGQ